MSKVDFASYKRIVQAFWDPEPRNDDVTARSIWCLGKQYHSRNDRNGVSEGSAEPRNGFHARADDEPATGQQPPATQEIRPDASINGSSALQHLENVDSGWPKDFLDDCEARAWFTYRSSFPPIKKSSDAAMTLSVRLRSLGDQAGFTSDTGWGCMIRSGQSLLANALMTLRLGRDWRRGIQQNEERQVLSLFADDPDAPFSIHRFVEHGASACGKHPGEWALCDDYRQAGLKVYVNGDGPDVYENKFLSLAKPGKDFTPTLILTGIRLGIDRITPVYWDALKESLRLPQSVGIAGGRPSSSHYFFATQGDHFFYLDPHFTRPALPHHANLEDYTKEDIESCHTRRLRRLPLHDMDPSMLIAFLIKDEADWREWRQAVAKTSGKSVIHVADSEPPLHSQGIERSSAVDDIETFDDEDEGGDPDEGDGEIVERPQT